MKWKDIAIVGAVSVLFFQILSEATNALGGSRSFDSVAVTLGFILGFALFMGAAFVFNRSGRKDSSVVLYSGFATVFVIGLLAAVFAIWAVSLAPLSAPNVTLLWMFHVLILQPIVFALIAVGVFTFFSKFKVIKAKSCG